MADSTAADGARAGGADVAAGSDDALFGYIERFASVLVSAGFPPMPARVFVALLVTDSGRLSAAELAGMLRISPAAVSGAVRYLIQLGLVHKERVPGSRRDYYRMPGNMWDDMLRLRDQVMSRWTALVREGIGLVGATPRPASGWPSRPPSSSSPPRSSARSSPAGRSTGPARRRPEQLAAG